MASRISSLVSNKRGKIILTIAIALILVIAGVITYLIYSGNSYITTENARISAPLINVSALNNCQIIELRVDIGTFVKHGQPVAEVGQPRSFDPSMRQGSKGMPLGDSIVESPVDGYIAAVWAYPGSMVSAGQPIVTVFDSSDVWVTANIDETKINNIRPGQLVKIKVDSLGGRKLIGTVEGIAPAAAASFSLLPQQNTTSNFIKVVQVVPVKITIDNPRDILLMPGTSVEVEIDTR